MKETPEEELLRRRRTVVWLRYCADRQELVAAEMRKRADELDPDAVSPVPGIVREP